MQHDIQESALDVSKQCALVVRLEALIHSIGSGGRDADEAGGRAPLKKISAKMLQQAMRKVYQQARIVKALRRAARDGRQAFSPTRSTSRCALRELSMSNFPLEQTV